MFTLMADNESPATVFDLIYTRFPDPGLDDHVYLGYDNACNLETYALNREPHFFRSFDMHVDALHAKGHVCAPIYSTGTRRPLCLLILKPMRDQSALLRLPTHCQKMP